MNINTRKRYLAAALMGLMMAVPASIICAQKRPRSQNRPSSHSIRHQIHEDQQKLRSDSRQFGKKSPQAKADRKQLRTDENRLRDAMENASRTHRRNPAVF